MSNLRLQRLTIGDQSLPLLQLLLLLLLLQQLQQLLLLLLLLPLLLLLCGSKSYVSYSISEAISSHLDYPPILSGGVGCIGRRDHLPS